MAKEKAQPQPALQEDSVSQLGAIQNIILGPALAEFRQRLAEVQEQMAEQHNELGSKIAGVKESEIASLTANLDALSKRFEAFEETMKRELGRLEAQKSNWEEMGNLIIQLGESVKKANQ